MEFLQSQLTDVLERIRGLEKRERKSVSEMQRLSAENQDLHKQVSTSLEKIENLERLIKDNKTSLLTLQRENNSLEKKLKTKQAQMENSVAKLVEQGKNQKTLKQQSEDLSKIRTVLNRALVQAHTKRWEAGKGEGAREEEDQSEESESSDDSSDYDDYPLKPSQPHSDTQRKDESQNKSEVEMAIERLKSVTRRASKLSTSVQHVSSSQLPTTIKKAAKMASSGDKTNGLFEESIFCAQLSNHPPGSPDKNVVKANVVGTVINSSIFDSKTGCLNPNRDGLYYAAWIMQHVGHSKLRHLLGIEGVNGRIYLGKTEKAGDVCSGSLVLPLKKNQKVWLEISFGSGENADTKLRRCNFMGWMLKGSSYEPLEAFADIQKSLFATDKMDCKAM